MYTLDFEIRGLPTLINAMSRAHWAVAYREAKKWKRWVFIIVRTRRPAQPLTRARVEFTRFSYGRGVDCDNLAISFKAVRDGLVEAGILANDAPENIVAEYTWVRAEKNQGRIKVTVTEL